MNKITLVAVALLLPVLAGAATPPPPAASQTAPQSTSQTSRSQARKQMLGCQKKAAGLKGAAKQTAVQDCMRTGG